MDPGAWVQTIAGERKHTSHTELTWGVLLEEEKGEGEGKGEMGEREKEWGEEEVGGILPFKRTGYFLGAALCQVLTGRGQMCLDVNTVYFRFLLSVVLCVTLPTHGGDKGLLFRKSYRNRAWDAAV